MQNKIQYASDLHLEFYGNKEFMKQNRLQPEGNILVLAGDIVPFAEMNKHNDFFSYVADHFEITYWLPGNHEYYRFDMGEKIGILQEKIRNNVFLVNNISFNHENTRLIFSTLWSKISPSNQLKIERSLSDFRLIKKNGFRFSAEHFNHLHEESLEFIQNELQMCSEKKVVVCTHHCPTHLNYPEQYKGDVLNEAFAVELYDLIETSNISHWIYGHHHTNTPDFNIGNTKLITNQLGYVELAEHKSFQQSKCLFRE